MNSKKYKKVLLEISKEYNYEKDEKKRQDIIIKIFKKYGIEELSFENLEMINKHMLIVIDSVNNCLIEAHNIQNKYNNKEELNKIEDFTQYKISNLIFTEKISMRKKYNDDLENKLKADNNLIN